ncbi:hypothetical protein MBEHAL_0899 [Halarchaeum acidiphilum MH1-52-1]|uniref:Uncharacterized protein n=2 Tax=Halarchaeum acidiphilum TaxID=489138 RepID=U3A3B0_9EURY|nr:hypothetical protein [Halarchaeum acidiphilum]GAD52139.1 hypothetical protein MBEHAL_0899 [Halarchaeum acidiphilum MH1-52-1]
MGARTSSVGHPDALNDTTAPVVVTLAQNYDAVAPKLDGYHSTTYRLTATDTPTVFFVRNDTAGASTGTTNASVRSPANATTAPTRS